MHRELLCTRRQDCGRVAVTDNALLTPSEIITPLNPLLILRGGEAESGGVILREARGSYEIF